MNTPDVVAHVFATLAAVIALGTVLGRLCRLIGQPAVIGEIAAGIVLGPSFVGAIWPEIARALVPDESTDPSGHVMTAILAVSQLGVTLYVFLVGLDLNLDTLRDRSGTVVAVAFGSIAAPLGIGILLAVFLHETYAPPGVGPGPFGLFLGTALAVTALPVLARILASRNLIGTSFGTLALGCAAANDLIAWCLLAVVVGVSKSDPSSVVRTIAFVTGFILLIGLIVRPVAGRVSRQIDRFAGPVPEMVLPVVLVAVLLAGATTEAIGVHAVLGAFLLGVVIPHDGRLARDFSGRLTPAVTGFLLPAFFAFSGLRTDLRLIEGRGDLAVVIGLALVSSAAKIGGTVLAGGLIGGGWRRSLPLGAAMNASGLMALIVLSVGLRHGVIGPRVYAMAVVVALLTTLSTAPLLSLTLRRADARQDSGEP